jgi:hypothetical protein
LLTSLLDLYKTKQHDTEVTYSDIFTLPKGKTPLPYSKSTMCKAIWVTGAACAHIGHNADGSPIPTDEKTWWAHGVFVIDGDRCAKYTKNRAHCKGHDLAKATYKELTADMVEPKYELCEAQEIRDEQGNSRGEDSRCTKCQGREIGSNKKSGNRY